MERVLLFGFNHNLQVFTIKLLILMLFVTIVLINHLLVRVGQGEEVICTSAKPGCGRKEEGKLGCQGKVVFALGELMLLTKVRLLLLTTASEQGAAGIISH